MALDWVVEVVVALVIQVIFALAGSMLLSLTLMPVLASLVLPQGRKKPSPWWARLARRAGAAGVLRAAPEPYRLQQAEVDQLPQDLIDGPLVQACRRG